MLGAPIISAVCYCDDCQAAARQIEALPNAPLVKDRDGGTSYIIYRKDRVECSSGQEYLQTYKLNPDSATKRMVASCCHSALFLGFDDSKHWVDIYRSRVEGEAPAPELRLCTRFKPLPDDGPTPIPGYPGYPLRFIARLLVARIAMWLHI
jgi:hypothetical protein